MHLARCGTQILAHTHTRTHAEIHFLSCSNVYIIVFFIFLKVSRCINVTRVSSGRNAPSMYMSLFSFNEFTLFEFYIVFGKKKKSSSHNTFLSMCRCIHTYKHAYGAYIYAYTLSFLLYITLGNVAEIFLLRFICANVQTNEYNFKLNFRLLQFS